MTGMHFMCNAYGGQINKKNITFQCTDNYATIVANYFWANHFKVVVNLFVLSKSLHILLHKGCIVMHFQVKIILYQLLRKEYNKNAYE